jgi:hypothetical protein
MARLNELNTKIKEVNKKTGEIEDADYSPLVRKTLKDIQQHGVAKATGWAVAATGKGLKTSTAWASRKVLGNTVGGFLSDKIESLGSGSGTGTKGIIASIESLKSKLSSEFKDLITTEKTVVKRLEENLKEYKRVSVEEFIDRLAKTSKEITGNNLSNNTMKRLEDNVSDTYVQGLDKNVDYRQELDKTKKDFIEQWKFTNPDKKSFPKALEKQLDSLINELVDQIETDKEEIKRAEISDEKVEKLLQKIEGNLEYSTELASIERAKADNSSYAAKEAKDDDKKDGLLDNIKKYFPLLAGGLSSILGIFKGFPTNLISGLMTGLTSLIGPLLSPILSLLGKVASKVLGVAANTVAPLAARALTAASAIALPVAAVAGAGYAGWKTGEALEKNFGDGETGNRVAKILSFFGNDEATQAIANEKKYNEMVAKDKKPLESKAATISPPKVVATQVPVSSKADQLHEVKQSYDKIKEKSMTPATPIKESVPIINSNTTNNITQKSTIKINPSRNTESSYQRMTDRLSISSVV